MFVILVLVIIMAAFSYRHKRAVRKEAKHMAWCDSIYHQDTSCREYGRMKVPPEVQAKREAEYLNWCDWIKHRDAGCPGFEKSERRN